MKADTGTGAETDAGTTTVIKTVISEDAGEVKAETQLVKL